jgi:Tfp pilus assembly protein PilF/predicted Ser/Thr protein kinase
MDGLLPVGGIFAGKYRVLGEIGRGGMGVVYKAEDIHLKRVVALKLLPPAAAAVPASKKRLLQEARTASALNHPGICIIYEVGEAGENSYIAMEYVEGRSLDRVIPPGGLPWAETLRIGAQIVEALEQAHERGVIHRDLKTANIMITPAGRAKILDFGLAKRLIDEEIVEATRSQAPLSEEDAISGTLPYMAPETLQGRPADARGDIWALGAILYEMAAGSRPFEGRTRFELTSAILRDAPAPLPDRIPKAGRAVIGGCLEKDLEKRFQTAGEVRAALHADAPAKQAPAAAGSRRLVKRPVVWMGAAALLLAALALFVFLKPISRGAAAPRTGKEGAVLSTGARPSPKAEANEYFEKGMLFLRAQFNLPSARKMLERALSIDPQFAEARGWYGFAFLLEIDGGYSNDSVWLYKAEQELRRALQDDPDSARAHASMAALSFYQNRKEQIPEEAAKALALNPHELDAMIWWANYHASNNDYGPAKKLMNEALVLDPLFFPARMCLADFLHEDGDNAAAAAELDKILEQDPRSVHALRRLARLDLEKNDSAAARRRLEGFSAEERKSYEFRLVWALLLAVEGKAAEARAEMDEELLKYGSLTVIPTASVAEVYAVLGDTPKALDWLERIVRGGDERDIWFRRDPFLANIRNLPRFRQIVDSILFRRKTRGGK